MNRSRDPWNRRSLKSPRAQLLNAAAHNRGYALVNAKDGWRLMRLAGSGGDKGTFHSLDQVAATLPSLGPSQKSIQDLRARIQKT